MNTIKIVLTLVCFVLLQLGFSQKTTQTLAKTLIIKIKEEHRNKCSNNNIEIVKLNTILNAVGVNNVSKMFPQKTKNKIKGNVDISLLYEISYQNNISEQELIRKIKKLKIAEYVEPYYIPELAYTPNDTILPSQYCLSLINAENAWGINKGDTNIVIGITDTGWDTAHIDLQANVKVNYADPVNGIDDDNDGYIDNNMGWDLGMNDNNAHFQSSSHGVNVAGLAAAVTDNVAGTAGVGFNCKFLPVKISNNVGVLTRAYQGIVYAADHGCFIINCSWGSYVPSQFGQDIIDYATINKGSLVVAAVGNDDDETVFYPAGYDGVLSVAASEQSDLKADFSNHGYYVDVSAPGESLQVPQPNNNYGTNGGTSMASPVVAGGAGILKAQFPTYNNYQIAALIQATADDLNPNNSTYIDKLGSGRLNLFNGVSANSVQFLELINHQVSDNNNAIFEAGDTLNITGLFQNLLDPITTSTVTLTTTSSFVNIIDGTTTLPALATLDTVSNYSDRFTVEVLNGASLNEVIVFKAVISNGSFANNEYFEIILNPDYINLAENQISTTITSNGKIGLNDNSKGLGFNYNGESLLFEGGLMIGDDFTRVADVVRGVSGRDQDFLAQQNVRFNPPYVSALDLFGTMNDGLLTSPMNIDIKQLSYAYANAPDDKYVIVVYDITNSGLSPLTNVYAGIFADWDIDDAGANKAGFDTARKMGYVHSTGIDTIYAAIKVLSSNNAVNYALDLDGSDVVDPNGNGYSSNEKYTSLSTNRNVAGGSGGADVAHVVSSGGFNLATGAKVTVAFAIIAGDSLSDIQMSADSAQYKYDMDALSVVENNINSTGFNVYPNPTNGILKINSLEKINQINVKNVMGEVVQTFRENTIDISSHSNGIYFVEVISRNKKSAQKVVLLR
ncbi:MAG: S8 family serine peptidase [Vicingaceae bacterium]